MSCILEQCYNQFIEEFPESWLPNGSEDESVFFVNFQNWRID